MLHCDKRLRERGSWTAGFRAAIGLVALVVGLLHGAAVAQTESQFKVGVIMPLTGALAEYGAAAKNGIELAKKEHPAEFSKIAFLYDDSQYDGKKTLSAYQKLRLTGDVSLYYVWGNAPSQALIPVSEADRSPLFAGITDRTAAAGRRYVTRFCYDGEMASESLVNYMRSRGFKKLGVVKAELAFINDILDGMQKRMQKDEDIELIDTFEAGDMDFKTSLAKLKERRFDALGVFLVSGQVSQFYRQSRQLGIQAQTLGTDFLDSMQEVRDAGGAMTGAVFASVRVNPAFVLRYKNAYRNDLQLTAAASGYELAMLVAQVFGDVRTRLSADEVVSKLRGVRPHSAGAAEYEFRDAGGSAGFDFKVGMRRVEKDRIVDITE